MRENLNPMSKGQAILLSKSKFYEDWIDGDIVAFQLFTSKLCMPFGILHKATETVLNRPIWIHEFGSRGHLQEEFIIKLKSKKGAIQ